MWLRAIAVAVLFLASDYAKANETPPLPERNPLRNSTPPPLPERNPRRTAPPECANTTVFYRPNVQIPKSCAKKARLRVLDHLHRESFLEVCKDDEKKIDMEGAARIEDLCKKEAFLLNWETKGKYRRLSAGQARRCPYAYGALDENRRPVCLDPMYSVAADPRFYKTGDVVFFPDLVGMPIPEDYRVDGDKHDGFMIVRDIGDYIKGQGRFDMFSGSLHWSDRANPFSRRGFSNQKNCHKFEIITGEKADEVRKKHNFPNSRYSMKISTSPPEIEPGKTMAENDAELQKLCNALYPPPETGAPGAADGAGAAGVGSTPTTPATPAPPPADAK